jgi:hypothetical protein
MYQNFFGKDPMKWWIGQVTDPDKGEWGDSLEKTKAENPEDDIYTLRCRVRIVGYHACEDDLPDQGGEVVVGFFFDGDDAQQPVIFGTLFKQSFIGDQLSSKDFDGKKHTCFVPYTPPKVRQRAGKHRFYSESPWPGQFSPGEALETIATKQKEAGTNITIDNFTACEDNEISKISNAVKDFTRKMETLQQLNEQSSYVDPIYGGVINIQDEIKLTTSRIQNSTTKLVRRARSWLIQDTLDKLNATLKDQTPKTLQAPVGQATKSLTDVIFCNIEKIQGALEDYLSKSLENMIGQVLDVPICGVENFLADMFGQINNILDSGLGDIFSQLNNIQGGGIGLPSKTFSKAIKFANIITNVLDCDSLNCPENTTYSSKNGVSRSIGDSFDSIIDKVGLSSLVNPLVDNLNDAIPATPSKPDCQTDVLKCGPPRVDFIGGTGQGATGSAIVNALGNIIGVAINGTGFGFKEPPLLSFFDSCDKGYGAGGYPIMGSVSPLIYTESDKQRDLISLSELPDGVGSDQIAKIIPDGKQVGDAVFDNNENSNKIKDVGLEVNNTNLPVYVSDPNGNELGVVGVVITNPGQEYLSNTTETDIDGNVKELIPDPNANYDGEQSYVTSLDDVIVENTGFGYGDDDTASVSGGSVGAGAAGTAGAGVDGDAGSVSGTPVDAAGNILPGDATGDIIQKPGQAQVELNIRDGLIVGVNVVNGGFGFTGLPEITINSDTGAGAKLLPVLKFTKVDDAFKLADTNSPFNRNLPVVTVISCIEK